MFNSSFYVPSNPTDTYTRRQTEEPTVPLNIHIGQQTRREYPQKENACLHNFVVIDFAKAGELLPRPAVSSFVINVSALLSTA